MTGELWESGTTLKSRGFEEETCVFLQRRLLYVSMAFALLMLSFGVAILVTQFLSELPFFEALIAFATEFPGNLLSVDLLLMTVVAFVLRSRSFSARGLVVIDALVTFGTLALPLWPYAEVPTLHHCVSGLLLFILTRAVLVPSSAILTISLALPAALGVLWVDLSNPNDMVIIVVDQVLIVGGIVVAALASHVNVGLRRRTYEAKHLGQYMLERKLGEGAMGAVYRATHTVLKRPTAIKFLRPEIAGTNTIQRFEREVQQTCRLTHPNTISIFDYGHTAEGIFYYAMEFADGRSLAEIVESDGPLEPDRAIHVLSQACGALAEAHDLDIVHRDVKAANIMLCRQGGEDDVVKVLDFGLVKDLASQDPSASLDGQLIGTPETMAPEIIRGQGASPSSDLYALAVVGYTLLCGKRIFDAQTAPEFLAMHLGEAPIPLRDRDASIPSELEAVILRGLAKEPAQRFADAREMRRALQECLGTAGARTQS